MSFTVCIYECLSCSLSTSRLLFGFCMTESKGRITLEYLFFFSIYLFKKVHDLVLHFVKSINSNINIKLKVKENIFSMLRVL